MKLILGIIFALVAGGALAQDENVRKMIVSGEGIVSAIPDVATITLGVTTEAKTAQQALFDNSQATASVLQSLESAGIDARDLQTSNLSLSPIWSNSSVSPGGVRQITGYAAQNTITVRVRALDLLGEILDAAVTRGANRFDGLRFDVQDPKPLLDEARRLAVADAMEKAALYAQAAGVTLGPVLELRESGATPQPVMLERMALSSAPVPVARGEVSLSAQVTMEFALTD